MLDFFTASDLTELLHILVLVLISIGPATTEVRPAGRLIDAIDLYDGDDTRPADAFFTLQSP